MRTLRTIFITCFSSILIFSCLPGNEEAGEKGNWLQWRGPGHTGASPGGNPPVVFSETENLKWKTVIPGKGHATPIVWKDKIVVLTSVPTAEKQEETLVGEENPGHEGAVRSEYVHEYRVILVDRNNGKIVWDKTVAREKPREGTHELGSWASNSPCTDGTYIYAYFGSRGIYCLDFKGNLLWQKDFGQMKKHMNFGEGESPFLYGDRLFVQWDHNGDSFLFSLDKKTGREVWKAARDEVTSWSTPLVIEVDGAPQVVTNAPTQVRSYDYETGELMWTATGMTLETIPNPVYGDGILYLTSGFRGSALLAINPSGARGDINGTSAILWTYNQDTPYTPNLLLMEGRLYFMRGNNGSLTCLNAKTGGVIYSKQKLEGISTLFSSPTGAAGKIYVASKNQILVLRAGDIFEVLAHNKLDDDFIASPVIAGKDLILRGFGSLYCFSE